MTQLRQISGADAKAHTDIHALLHRCFAYMQGRIDPPSSLHRLTVDGIADHAENQEIWGYDDPVQAVMFLTRKPHALYLGRLAVASALRGQGLARACIACAEHRARVSGYQTLELQTRIELTENHITFEKLGFHKTAEGRHAGYDRTTEITMQKPVSFADS